MKNLIAILILLVSVPALGAPGATAVDPVMTAMELELDRSVTRLRLDAGDYDLPYFVYYSVRDIVNSYASAKNGALFVSNDNHSRMSDVDIRVGSYDMDSSEDKDAGFNFNQKYSPGFLCPVEDSVDAIRRTLWLQSDHAYKAALMSFHNVKAKLVNSNEERKSASLSREEPVLLIEEPADLGFDRARFEQYVKDVSAVFNDYPLVFDSSVEASGVRIIRYIVNSEGTRIRSVDRYYQVQAQAAVRAADGMLLQDGLTFYGRTVDDLPPVAEAVAGARKLAGHLVALRDAPVLDPATVPVLMSPEATGVFFHETIGHRLEGQRQEDEEEGRTFKSYLNQEILPTFLNIYDDPSINEFTDKSTNKTKALNGSYRTDDEGVRGARASLVEKGVLKSFLMSRKPIEGFEKSNGHGRTQGFRPAQARMANLFIEGLKPVSQAKLFKRFLDEMKKQGKPWGLYVETIAGGNTNTSSYGYQAFKGMPRIVYKVDARTGEKTLVRGVELVGTPLSAINRIIATSDRYGVFNGYCGAESGSVPVSTVAPEVLFSEMELQRTEDTNERPLILPAPGGEEVR